jgi:hypothetical protein
VDILNSNLEAVETLGFRRCDFRCKIAAEILVDNAIRCGEEGKNIGDEVALIVS